MKSRKSAIKTDLFAADLHHQKLDQLGDPLLRIGACIDFTALAHAFFLVHPGRGDFSRRVKLPKPESFPASPVANVARIVPNKASTSTLQSLPVSPGESARRSVSFCLVTVIELFFQLFQPMARFCGEDKRIS
ncbi:hypothetical protein DLNHIDIE_02996 [Acidithiobacillus thiooxidans ATCC 19377]|uniref:Uncharacterized protein n=1 Tax=Acidithiobacillus thiooxidans ATCC 19377 TaxID=637390 RepID=A0A543PZT5_ACITH|nr:hypothetical protein DLNHIDIE_02996 [Acidithiobacillus thiooxidans ATCC 19377]